MMNTYESPNDWLRWGLTKRQPLWVILSHLPEKGRKEIEGKVEEKGKRNSNESENKNRRNKSVPPLPLPATRIAVWAYTRMTIT